MYLANKAVEYVVDDAIVSGYFKLSYDFYANKTTNSSTYGRYFRTYLDNAAHPFDAATGKASANDTSGSFFHMMDYQNVVYTTNDVDHLSANQDNIVDTNVIPVSATALDGDKWYRVVIEGDLNNKILVVSYYLHGEDGVYAPENISDTPQITGSGYFTEDRTAEIRQIKFMRTQGGDLYYDNIKLERESATVEQ